MRILLTTLILSAICTANARADVFDLFEAPQPVSTLFDGNLPKMNLGGDACCTGTCCEESCTSTACCQRHSGWTARADYVHMWRERTGSSFPILIDQFTAPAFDNSDFDFSSSPGLDVGLLYQNECRQGLEFRYLWLDDFESNQSLVSNNTLRPATNPETGLLVSSALPWLIDYSSEFQSFELLGRQPVGQFNLSYGFRYVELDEALSIVNPLSEFSIPGVFEAEDYLMGFGTANDLYGFQIGLDGPLWDNGKGLRIIGVGKAGIYYNDRDAFAVYNFFESVQNQVIFEFRKNQKVSDDTASLLTEMGLRVEYDLTRNLSIRAGYQAIYIDGVALASDQVPNTGNLASPGPSVPIRVDKSSLFLHGLHVGGEYRF